VGSGIYSLGGYGRLIADRGRTDAYAHALEAIIRPGSTVLDLGSGTGVFALLAAKFGARKVYAIESSDFIEVARELAAANGFADKIEFIQGYSTEIDLPEKVDVIVSDIRGVSPLFAGSAHSLIDARERFLAVGGVMIPACDTIFANLVNAPEQYEEITKPWSADLYGLDSSPARRYALNLYDKARFTASNFVAEPQRWVTLDYRRINEPSAAGQLCWTIEKVGLAHGLAVWFDCETYQGAGFSNSPASAERHLYGQQFFPFLAPISLQSGDRVEVGLAADVVRDDYIWRWDTKILDKDGALKSEIRQSTLAGAIVAPAQLRKRGHSFIPKLGVEAQVDKFVLEQMAASRSLGDIARDLMLAFPNRFADWQSALGHVADLSTKYAL
jgi:protein arginine N-methyltransferase 1